MLWLSFIQIFFCKGHILSTGGAALTHKHERVDRIKWDSFKCYHLGHSLCSLSQLLIILLTWNFHFGASIDAVILSVC
jgi:hypothetical protein